MFDWQFKHPFATLRGKAAKKFAANLQLDEKTTRNYSCSCVHPHGLRFYRLNESVASFYFNDSEKLHSADNLWQGDLPLTGQSKQRMRKWIKEANEKYLERHPSD